VIAEWGLRIAECTRADLTNFQNFFAEVEILPGKVVVVKGDVTVVR